MPTKQPEVVSFKRIEFVGSYCSAFSDERRRVRRVVASYATTEGEWRAAFEAPLEHDAIIPLSATKTDIIGLKEQWRSEIRDRALAIGEEGRTRG